MASWHDGRPARRSWPEALACFAVAVAIAAAVVMAFPSAALPAGADHRATPVTAEAKRWKPQRWWLRQAFCVHRHESVDWHRAGVDWRGRRSPYYGGMQFLIDTWRRAGGTGLPSSWSKREQLYRAWRIYRLYRTAWRPGSWREWGTASRCGLA